MKSPRRPASPTTTVVRIGLVQSACTADREANIAQAIAGIAAAAKQGAQVVCLQELFAGEYPCQAEDHGKFTEAEAVPGPLTERLAVAAKEHGVVLVGSVFERRSAGLFHNTGRASWLAKAASRADRLDGRYDASL